MLYCDLWGCLHDGRRVFPEAVAALERFRENGGAVVLLTNSPRPSRDVALQVRALGAPDGCYDLIVSSGDAAQAAMAAGLFGRRVHHIGPDRDAGFFLDDEGAPVDVERVPLAEADGIVCTGLFDDRTETPEDYRATLLDARSRGLKLLCANPDVVVDVGDRRIYCAGALAEAYAAAGGESYFFGKPHPPIYALTRQRLSEALGLEPAADEILCLGDGLATDIRGATGEGLDALFITGGLSAMETATSRSAGPDPERLAGLLARERLAPRYAMAVLR
jgi:HAD superfamily hydrolase (TIGR01459 family)